MPALRARLAALLTVTVASTLLLTGCSTSASSPEPPAAAIVAPAAAVEYGVVAGSGTVSVQLWTDLSCPHCRSLETVTGADIQRWVEDGDIRLTIHPLNFVSEKRGDDTDWSTRAANALAAVADAGQADRIPAFYALLQEHQVSEAGALDDDGILALAAQAGVTADIREAVESQRFADWVSASNEHWIGRTIDGTAQVVQGVPILVVDGQVFEIRGDGTDGARLQAMVEAALTA